MKRISLLLTIIVMQFSCSNKIEPGNSNNTKSQLLEEGYRRVPGTKIIGKIPDHFIYEDKAYESEYARIKFDYGSIGFDEFTANMDEEKFTKVNQFGFPAYYLDIDEKDERVKVLIMDVKGKALTCIARMDSLNAELLAEVDMILGSVNYKEDLVFDAFENTRFSFDTGITGFKLAESLINNSYRFTKDGTFDDANKYVNNIYITERIPMDSARALKLTNKLRSMGEGSDNSTNGEITKRKIGKYEALIYESESRYDNRTLICYHAFLTLGDKTIQWICF